MRAGASLARAVERASTMQPLAGAAFAPALDALRRGQPVRLAIERVDVERARPLGVVVPVLRACTELGGPAAPPLERAAATLHGRADADAERWAHSAQARLSAAVLTVLPVGVLALLAAGEPSIRASLMTPPGMICVVAGGLLNASGWCWMRRVIGAAP
jgi:tight adherence protein B